jgi:DNA uptake protein ComE-like DNA-binding protein
MMKRSESKRPSESFVLGVVALVFLIIGYQTAMFVYKASVMKIVANRDMPDTVFVYQQPESATESTVDRASLAPKEQKTSSVKPTPSSSGRCSSHTIVRKNAPHSPQAEAVRQNLPRRKVESFRFNPNTASEDQLCRLGFSPKQARSIINYREKGGKYRRPEDFAKSFVVSDSIYRRLEQYIDIPLLDLNLADSADFDALPGIGGWFASKMVEHRNKLMGYSYKEQLMDIWKFDQQKFDALSDLVTVSSANLTPYPLWSLPADSLRKHPYIRNYETAKAIVLFRENNPIEKLSVPALQKEGILASEYASKLSRCAIASPEHSPKPL